MTDLGRALVIAGGVLLVLGLLLTLGARLPGVGRLLIEAITKRDFVTLQGVVLFIGVAFVLVNLAVDAAYALLDPRVGERHAR